LLGVQAEAAGRAAKLGREQAPAPHGASNTAVHASVSPGTVETVAAVAAADTAAAAETETDMTKRCCHLCPRLSASCPAHGLARGH
jgi:hypothetical protein